MEFITEMFSNTWFSIWYALTCISMLYIQLGVFKVDIKKGYEVSFLWFLYGMFWVFCPILNVVGQFLWIIVVAEEYNES